MRSSFQIVLFAGVFCLVATIAPADSEIVIAIRYLQAQGTSHSHLYLYREDGKLLRPLTKDDSGQDSAPIFSPDGEMVVFTREEPNHVREFWSVTPHGTDFKKLDAAPDLVRAGEKLAVLHKRRAGTTSFGNSDELASRIHFNRATVTGQL
jgi:Tol biopolymer transport system component